jgi:two-component sensor histidine kinase
VTIEAVVMDALPECTTLTALNGFQGLAQARRENPDVILLDIVMPEMDGFTVCRTLKADENLKNIPVIFLTALRTDRVSRIQALEAGAEAFLSKPVDEPELIAQIRAMAQIKEARERQQKEKEHLSVIVAERTRDLQKELEERRRAEEELKVALKEKEVLLRELYHRTKNNMQVISSLLQLKKDQIRDETLARAFTEMENRIQSMALVHRKLYQSQDLTYLNLGEYIRDLVNLVRESYVKAISRVEVVLETEDIKSSIDTTIPCGLIVNELLSNAYNHAFPLGENGLVRIWLIKNGDGFIELGVSDNGVGIGPEFDLEQNSRLGLQIIRILGENQLGGKVSFETDQGLTCRVRFPEAKERVWI